MIGVTVRRGLGSYDYVAREPLLGQGFSGVSI